MHLPEDPAPILGLGNQTFARKAPKQILFELISSPRLRREYCNAFLRAATSLGNRHHDVQLTLI